MNIEIGFTEGLSCGLFFLTVGMGYCFFKLGGLIGRTKDLRKA